jgi:hypothetical protein
MNPMVFLNMLHARKTKTAASEEGFAWESALGFAWGASIRKLMINI